jgi:hypothetical protein
MVTKAESGFVSEWCRLASTVARHANDVEFCINAGIPCQDGRTALTEAVKQLSELVAGLA